jgi:citrate synthase
VCKINGNEGRLSYRGYSIEELVQRSSFLEVAYLLIYGNLPSETQLDTWNTKIMHHTFIHEDLIAQMKCSRYNSHPQSMVAAALTSMGSLYPEANPALAGLDIYTTNVALRNKQIFRILGKLPTIAACAYRHRIGRPYNMPLNNLSYTENFLYMLDRLSENDYKPHPVLVRALEKLWIVHAEHGLNCSTATMRQLSSTRVEPFAAVSGAALALYGPLHGGANEAALRMLREIGTVENIPGFLAEVKAKKKKLMGFGHRVYRSYDPRARIVKDIAEEVFALLGKSPLMEVAVELEKQALADDYFVSRKLAPNVDFYSGLVYHSMGFPVDMFPVLFTIPRAVGWLAHWKESLESPADEQKIFRPQQLYTGPPDREYIPIEDRESTDEERRPGSTLPSLRSNMDTRRNISSTMLSEMAQEAYDEAKSPYSIPKTAGKQD